ncbi:MAG TPA: alpha/beta fold hydrolase [Candidatus Limnocylindrales bacterium]|nr:alpha/beta fold hydrolase [Candidatus Limnocylindrales bacterium]
MTTEPIASAAPADAAGVASKTADAWVATKRGDGAYADVNGVHLYYETFTPPAHGAAAPLRTLILLHGGLGSGEMFDPVIPALAEDRRVITVDLQAHGRTADVDRPIDPRAMAEDVAELIRHLGLAKPDVLGYSLGGGVALHLAAAHPEHIGKAIIVSAHAYRDATYPELRAQSARLGAAAAEFMRGTPMYELYHRVAPRAEDFGRLLDKMGAWIRSPFDYRAEYASLRVPTLIACADADGAPPRHYVELFESLGGGQRDGNWDGSGRPDGGHAFAVIPGETHYSIFASPQLVAAAKAFLG